jgi:DNA-binding transcriptional LysR family regulator
VLGSSPVIAIAAREFFSEIPTHLSLAELGALPLIFRERGSHTQAKLITASRDNDIILRPVIEVEGREAMRELVASGLGIGFVCEAEIGADDRLARISIGVDSSAPRRANDQSLYKSSESLRLIKFLLPEISPHDDWFGQVGRFHLIPGPGVWLRNLNTHRVKHDLSRFCFLVIFCFLMYEVRHDT